MHFNKKGIGQYKYHGKIAVPDSYSVDWRFNEHFYGKGYTSARAHDFIDKNGIDSAIIQAT